MAGINSSYCRLKDGSEVVIRQIAPQELSKLAQLLPETEMRAIFIDQHGKKTGENDIKLYDIDLSTITEVSNRAG